MFRHFLFVFLILFTAGASAASVDLVAVDAVDEIREFDPLAPEAMDTLREFDQAYREQTGIDTMFEQSKVFGGMIQPSGGCYRATCRVFANVVKAYSVDRRGRLAQPQMLYLYIDGAFATSWKVSTAGRGHLTPNFDGHPSGPFYPGRYNSKKYPGGDYKGLGNMPYASFYNGGFAIHGTPSIGQLGRPASHGCVRSHPDNARYFSQWVRSVGAGNVWITVSQSPVEPFVGASAPVQVPQGI